MTTDDPTARPNETEQAAAELRKIFDLIDETVDAITDDEIEQRWRKVCDRSTLDVGNLVNETVDAFTDDETQQRWRPVRDRSSLGGVLDGQHRTVGIGDRSLWRGAIPGRVGASAAEAAAFEAMRDANREHLAAVEYRLMAAKAELQAAEARLELTQLREQEATVRAERAEQKAARAKEQAEKDAATAVDALADAALERSQEIIKRAHELAADLLADAQRQAAEVIAAAEEHARQRLRAEPMVSDAQWAGRPLLFVAERRELANSVWMPFSSAVISGKCQRRKSAIAVASSGALAHALPAQALQHALASGPEPDSVWTTLMDARIRPSVSRRRLASIVQRVRRCLGLDEPGCATSEGTDIQLDHAARAAVGAVELATNLAAGWTFDWPGGGPADPTEWWPSDESPAADRWRPVVVLTFVSNSDNVVHVRAAQEETNAERTAVLWTGRH